MNRREFVRQVTSVLRASDVKKPIHVPKRTFTITDDDGNSKHFSIKQQDKFSIYTVEDVEKIVEVCEYVAKECMKAGEPLTLSGFGSLRPTYRKERSVQSFDGNEKITIEGHYVPKFVAGDNLRKCAKVYGMSLDDRLPSPDLTGEEYSDIVEDDTDGCDG